MPPFIRATGLSRRSFLIGAGAVAVSGCSHSPTLQLVGDSFSQAFSGSANYPRTRSQVEALAYAQLGVRFGKGSRGILVLSEQLGDELHWVSSNRVMIATRKGRVVRTVGLQTDLANTQLLGPDLLDHYDASTPTLPDAALSRSVDLGSSFGIPVMSRFTVEGSETITILDQPFETLRVREDLQSDVWRWRARNYWWLSKRSPLAWRSLQYLGPDLPPLHIEVLKRPA